MKPKLCLNAIVRNESARIVRMLDSVKPYISTFAIFDTGSTDDTVAVIQQWANDNQIKGIVGAGTFVDFSQARNQGLELARSWWRHGDSPKFTYLLLCDADMELKVDDPLVFEDLTQPAYSIVQKAGGVSYHNLRVLHVAPEFKYVGVTHEYLDAPNSHTLSGVVFIDHADGANRPDKFTRDIRLLTTDLERDPDNARSWFYLANSYRDAGNLPAATDAFRRRIALGGWDEEVWNSRINLANCLQMQGLEDAYIKEAIAAYDYRPRRAETLHGLAKHYRNKGENNAAALFAEAGINTPRPDDWLFVEDWVYEWGLREEFSIAGFYTERTRQRAFEVNNGLALDPNVPDHVRHGARRNMVYYLKPLKDLCPSVKFTQIEFNPRQGYTAMNPCVARKPDGDLEVLVRTVNYKINEAGQYMIGEKGCWDAPIETENYIVGLADDLTSVTVEPVIWRRPPALFPLVIGLEDMRINWRHDMDLGSYRSFIACVREQSAQGQCEQWGGQIGTCLAHAHRISDGTQTEKNWVEWHDGRWVYRLDKLIDANGKIEKVQRDVTVENISGGSQWVPLHRGYVSVVHEAITHPNHGKRVYQHRFAWLSDDFQKLKLSLPFVFKDVQIEFCAGLAQHISGDFILSFGVRDAEAWLCKVSWKEVICALGL